MLPIVYMHDRVVIRWLLIEAVQRAWMHHQTIVTLYRRLAARSSDEQRARLLAQMATTKVRQQQRYERILLRLNAPLPRTKSSLFDQLLIWLLPHCGLSVALHWAAWIEQRDKQAILETILLLRNCR